MQIFESSQIDFNSYLRTQLPRKNINIANEIIIDYGSSTTKAGYHDSAQPGLVFRTLVNKMKDPKSMQTISLIGGNDIFRGNYQSPYELNLIHHSGLLESINDYIFSSLGFTNSIPPMCITECVANTEYSRSTVFEQLFECYKTPRLLVGIDSLFALFENTKNGLSGYLNQSTLLISFGDTATHVIPIIDGQIHYQNIKRVNVGGQQSLSLLYRTIQTRHKHLKNDLHFQFIEKLHHSCTEVATDYKEQLNYFNQFISNEEQQQVSKYYKDMISEENKIHQNQLKFINPIKITFPQIQNIQQSIQTEDDAKKKQENRIKQGERLREALSKKKQEKEQVLLQQLKEYEDLLQQDASVIKQQLENIVQGKGIEELKKRIKILKVKTGQLPKEVLDEDKFKYIDVPDSQLTPEQLNQKRYQIVMKQQQVIKIQKKQEELKKKEESRKFKEEQPELYIETLYERRALFLKKMEERKKKIQEMNTRNSRFNQRRMQTLAFLGSEEQKKDDTFGMRDEDWDLYRGINRELDSDEENIDLKLQELELELKELDQNYDQRILNLIANKHELGMDLNEITLSVDRIKCNEIYFQPSLIGVDQCGIIDAIMLSIRELGHENQVKLMQNIILTGGGALTKGLAERIKIDLQKECCQDMQINVTAVSDPIFDSWKGMKSFCAQYPQMVSQFSISRDEYFEYGASSLELVKTHLFSNTVMLD